MENRKFGTVKWFNEKKGYGLITWDAGGKDIFVHYSEIEGKGFQSLKEGERVEFTIKQAKRGLAAADVRKLKI